MTEEKSMKAAMEDLFIANPDLDRIDAHLNRFNPIRVMKMAHMEIRHSAILGWLLDPQETHGLGDKVLKSFLANALRTGTGESAPNISALDILQGDLRDAEVRIEWQNIDLLVICPTNKWVFVIENKFHSKQGETQLEDYANDIEKRYPDFRLQGVFLTLHGEKAKDRNRYRDTTYAQLLKCIHGVLLTERASLTTEVAMFIDHYIDVLKGATGMDRETEELKTLARNLYRDHKKALDFIMKHGKSNSIHEGVAAAFGTASDATPEAPVQGQINGKDYTIYKLGSSGISFLPNSWIKALGTNHSLWDGPTHYSTGLPLIIWGEKGQEIYAGEREIRLVAAIGGLQDVEIKQNLIELIKTKAPSNKSSKIQFQNSSTRRSPKDTRFFESKANSLFVRDVHNHEAYKSAFETLIQDFETEFDLVESAIKEWVAELPNIT